MWKISKLLKETFEVIKKKKTTYIFTSIFLTFSLIFFGVGFYYVKNTIHSIYKNSIEDNKASLVDVDTRNISEQQVINFEERFDRRDVYKLIEVESLRYNIYSLNLVDNVPQNISDLKVLECDADSLKFKCGSKPINDNEIALTDFASRYFYDYGIKNIYTEVPSSLIKEDLINLLNKTLVTNYGNLIIKGIIDTGFNLSTCDYSNDYSYYDLIENSVLFNEKVTNNIKNNLHSKNIFLKYPYPRLSSYELPINENGFLSFIHEKDTYQNYIYKLVNTKDEENDVYLSWNIVSCLIDQNYAGENIVTLPGKFNFNHQDLNTGLSLDRFLRNIDSFALEYAASKYYKEAYQNHSFDNVRYESRLDEKNNLSQKDKKDAYKLFLWDVVHYGITYDKAFNGDNEYSKILDCAKEISEFLLQKYNKIYDVCNKKIQYQLNDNDKGDLNLRGINLSSFYTDPFCIVSKQFFDKLNLKLNIYSSIHIQKDEVLSNLDSLINAINKNEGSYVFNNEILSDCLWLRENSFLPCKIIVFTVSALLFSVAYIKYFIETKYMFVFKKVNRSKDYKNIILFSISIISISSIISIILLPLFTFLSNTIIFQFAKEIPIIISGIPGFEYLYLLLGIALVSLIGLGTFMIFKHKINKQSDFKSEE